MLAAIDPIILAVIMLCLLLLLLLSSVPISIGLLAAALIMLLLGGKGYQTAAVVNVLLSGSTGFLLLALPLFVFMGEILFRGGVGADIYNAFSKWLNRVPGGLAVASIGSGAVFGAMCGVSAPGTAIVGIIAVPEMRKRGYPMHLIFGSLGAAGGLAMLIPPSLLLIVYASMTGTSVGALFIGAIFPGLILTGIYITYIIAISMFKKFRVPTYSVSWKDRVVVLGRIWPAIFMIFAVLGSIYFGIATPTESAAIGVIAALVICLFRRSIKWDGISESIRTTIIVSGGIYLIVIAGNFLAFSLSTLYVPTSVASFVVGLGLPGWGVFASIYLMFLILGCFMNAIPILVLTIPIVYPIIINLGIDPWVFGIVFVLNIETATLTPPVGTNLYVLKAIAPEYRIENIAISCLPFIWQEHVTMILVLLFPQIVVWLPTTMMR